MEQSNEEEILSEELDFTKPDFQFIPKGSHQWRQQGPYLVCRSCELEHATYIGMEYIMTGLGGDGLPILERR